MTEKAIRFEVDGERFAFPEDTSQKEVNTFVDDYMSGKQALASGDAGKAISDIPDPNDVDVYEPAMKDYSHLGESTYTEVMRLLPGYGAAADLAAGINKGAIMMADIPTGAMNGVMTILQIPKSVGRFPTATSFLSNLQMPGEDESLYAQLTKSGYTGSKSKFITRVGEEIGASLSGLTVFMKGAKYVDDVARQVEGVATSSTVQQLARRIMENPTKLTGAQTIMNQHVVAPDFMAATSALMSGTLRSANPILKSELASATGAGLGAATAGELAPGSIGAEIGGTMTGSVLATSPGQVVRLGKQIYEGATDSFTKEGMKRRVQQRMFDEAADIVTARESFEKNQELAVKLLGEDHGIPNHMLTDDLGIIKAIDSAASADPALLTIIKMGMDKVKSKLDDGLETIIREGNPEKVGEYLTGRINRITDDISRRILILEDQIIKRVSNMNADAPSEVLSEEFMEIVTKGMLEARDVEKSIWGALEHAQSIKIGPLKREIMRIKSSLLKTLRSSSKPTEEFSLLLDLPNTTNMDELLNYKSELSAAKRAAKSGDKPNYALARIIGEMEHETLKFIDTVGDYGPEYRAAVDFTRKLHDTYSRGPIGELMGTAGTGADRVGKAEALDKIARTGTKGATTGEAVLRVADGMDGEAAMKEVVDPLYAVLKDRFSQLGGDLKKQITFLDKYGPLLRKFPVLQKQIVNEHDNITKLARRKAALEGRKATLQDEKVIVAANLMEVDPDRIPLHLKGMSRKQLRQIKRATQSNRDAYEGLNTVVSTSIVRKLLAGDYGQQGMRKYFENTDNRLIFEEMLEPGQRKHILMMSDMIDRFHRTGGLGMGTGQQVGSNLFAQIVARIIGSAAGSAVAKKTGGSGLILAAGGSAITRLFVDTISIAKSRKIIEQAMVDPVLMTALLDKRIVKNPKEIQMIMRSHLVKMGYEDERDVEGQERGSPE